MKSYFRSPLHITIFSLEMFLLLGVIVTFILGVAAFLNGYHHGFFPNISFDFDRFFLISFLIFSFIFIIDLIVFFVRMITYKNKKQNNSSKSVE